MTERDSLSRFLRGKGEELGGTKTDILCAQKEKINEYLGTLSQPDFRSRQIFGWLHSKLARDFSLMTDIPKSLRDILEKDFFITGITIQRKQRSEDNTLKYLFRLDDGNCVESTVMFYEHGMSVCVSTQIGCRMGCKFCASSEGGLVRNLTISEILSQVYAITDDLNQRADSVVMMGIGEPLDNFCNVTAFYDMITDKDGYGLSNRSVSLSTCGLTDGIDRLAGMKKQLTLSVSLHAADDEKRGSIMPVNKTCGISDLIKSCREYQRVTRRRISFEYAVIAGFNDSDEDADRLAGLLEGMKAHVNLIPVNNIGTGEYKASRKDAERFKSKLEFLKINVTIRRTLGADIDAACGQLRRNNANGPNFLSR